MIGELLITVAVPGLIWFAVKRYDDRRAPVDDRRYGGGW